MNIGSALAKGKKALTNVFSAGASLYTQAPRTMGQAVGQAIVAPIENRRIQQDSQTDRLMQDRQMKTNPQSAVRYAERSANNQESFGRSLQENRKKAVVGTLGTIGMLYSPSFTKAPGVTGKAVSKAAQLENQAHEGCTNT